MSTYGNITAPAVSRLFCRENHVQYRYDGTSGNLNDPTELNRYGGGRHAEIMTPQSWSLAFRGGPATPDVTWYAVDELTATYSCNWPTATYSTTFTSPTLDAVTLTVIPVGGTVFPLTPYNFGGASIGNHCWVMRKGIWDIDISLDVVSGPYSGPWDLITSAQAFRDYTLYPSFRDQPFDTTSVTGFATHTPYTVGSPLNVVLRHNSLWDIGFETSPGLTNGIFDGYVYTFTIHAIRT